MAEALVGRQPIYDRDLEVYGYELLFRRAGEDRARFRDGDEATSQVILSAFGEIGLETVARGRRAFVNLTRAFIVGEYELPLPTEGVVLEVLEHIRPDAEVVAGLKALAERGFTIALDDFEPEGHARELLPFADIVKLDIRSLGLEAVAEHLPALRERERLLLAEQVRTHEEFQRCRDLGFELFQGDFLSSSYTVRGRRMLEHRRVVLDELTRWMAAEDPGAEAAADAALSAWTGELEKAGLLEPLAGAEEDVASELRNRAGVWVLARSSDAGRELVVSALLRARLCESLAAMDGWARTQAFFTTGLLSTLGSLLACSLTRVVEELPLGRDVRMALLSGAGLPGEALACATAYERGDWDGVRFRDLEPAELGAACLASLRWADAVADSLVDRES